MKRVRSFGHLLDLLEKDVGVLHSEWPRYAENVWTHWQTELQRGDNPVDLLQMEAEGKRPARRRRVVTAKDILRGVKK